MGQEVKTLIDSSNKVNAITLAYIVKLDFSNQKTSIRVQKIDKSPLKTYNIVLAKFLIQDSLRRI